MGSDGSTAEASLSSATALISATLPVSGARNRGDAIYHSVSLYSAGTSAMARLGRYRRPFDAEREADWIAESADLASVDVVLSGAKGWPSLDANYAALAAALSRRAGRTLEHQTYKQLCGEFHSASAFGFAVAVELACRSRRGVLLYTLSPGGAKAACCVQP